MFEYALCVCVCVCVCVCMFSHLAACAILSKQNDEFMCIVTITVCINQKLNSVHVYKVCAYLVRGCACTIKCAFGSILHEESMRIPCHDTMDT